MCDGTRDLALTLSDSATSGYFGQYSALSALSVFFSLLLRSVSSITSICLAYFIFKSARATPLSI